MGFDIPLGTSTSVHVGLNLPFLSYLPKFITDCAGYIVMYIGSDVFDDEVSKTRANWQSKDMKDFKRAQEAVEKESSFANYKTQFNLAKEYYREKRWKFLGESQLEMGVYAVTTGRWELDNDDPDVMARLVTARAGLGFTLAYSYSWTISYAVGPVPLYVTFTLGVSAGFALPYEINFCWVNGHFQNWNIKAIREITVNVGLSFSAQLGEGIKGFLEAWVRFEAGLNFMIRLYLADSEPNSLTIDYECSLAIGVTVFFVNASLKWSMAEGQLWPKADAANLLEHYMNADNDAPQTMEAAHSDPQSYGYLSTGTTPGMSSTPDFHIYSPLQVARVKGKLFAFYIGDDRKTSTGACAGPPSTRTALQRRPRR